LVTLGFGNSYAPGELGHRTALMKILRVEVRALMAMVAGLAIMMGLGIRSARLQELSVYHYRLASDYSARSTLIDKCGNGADELLMTIYQLPGGGVTLRLVSPEAERILQTEPKPGRG
jgi:hypothetical protein